jgi:hypothetical protein
MSCADSLTHCPEAGVDSDERTDDYQKRLKRMLAQFPPITDEARQRLIKVYASIEETPEGLRESA